MWKVGGHRGGEGARTRLAQYKSIRKEKHFQPIVK